MEKSFNKLKAEGERIDLPNECEENDRAVRYLALETGVGHFDNLNLLVMSVLVIFISVTFLAVRGGKINNDEAASFSKEDFFSGKLTQELEKRYLSELPFPEEIKDAQERVSLLYGFGNKLSEKPMGNYTPTGNDSQPDTDHNAFEPDDDELLNENAVTTKAVQTDKNGNTVTEKEDAETAPGGGTTAVSRPTSTTSNTTTEEPEEEETTTTNNEAPFVTTTTTSVNTRTTSDTSGTSESSEPDTDTSAPDTEPPVDSEPETQPSVTEPPVTESDSSELPAE